MPGRLRFRMLVHLALVVVVVMMHDFASEAFELASLE